MASPRRRSILLVVLAALACATPWLWKWAAPLVQNRGRALTPQPVGDLGPLAGVRLEPALGGRRFERPVFLTHAPGDPDAVYVVEQDGLVLRVQLDGSQGDVFLDLRSQVSREGWEEGLLGLAFPPDYAWQEQVFIYYSAQGTPRSVLARLTVRSGRADPASEEVLLEVEQPYRNHNGGALAFGPDGMLYLGLGDGGYAGDIEENGLDPSTLLGSILRLDVSRRGPSAPYAIPPDNPFVGRPDARGEVWAYGLRNPWRFSFDRVTGELWAGDVGQSAWEEVHLIERGGNYGWRAYEGFSVYDESSLELAADATPPLAAYGRGEGISITGGHVYRGAEIPSLIGRYVYADFGTGAVWALARGSATHGVGDPRHPTGPGVHVVKLLASGPPVASFGEDARGELYVCGFDGLVYRLLK